MRAILLASAAMFCLGASLPAQKSGLLLGLRVPDGYRTLWITAGVDSARVMSGEDLIVPGRDGFYRVCTPPYHSLDNGELDRGDSLAVMRADLPRGPCAAGDSLTSDEEQKAHCSSVIELKVTFAAPAALGVESVSEYNCGAHPSGESQVYLRRLAGGEIPITRALSAAEQRAWRARASAAAEKEFSEFGKSGGSPTDDGQHLELDDAIGIERGKGRWQATGRVSCRPHVACGVQTMRFSIPGLVLPKTLTGHDVPRPPMSSIATEVPGASDAFSSPNGDVVAVVEGRTLRVFTPSGRKLGSSIASIPLDGEVVMIEWATGRFVAQWSTQLASIFSVR